MDSQLVDTKEIAQILGYTFSQAAANLCRSGILKTARKINSSWCADRWEIEQYRDEVLPKLKKPRGPNRRGYTRQHGSVKD